VRARYPDLELLVIDDGSTDDTPSLLERLDVRWLRFPERMGIGSAMRAGLRYALRQGIDCVIRIDGDGQHAAEDIDRLLAPIRAGSADVVLGSRYADAAAYVGRPGSQGRRLIQRLLGACLSLQTGRRVTDPTSGFCALGPRAVRLLADHHPTGYPEPELRLFLSRNSLDVVEVPVMARPRLGGTSSLTAWRMTAAGARVLLALIVVPLRSTIGGTRRE
jgi:glycosyltransferase involved in cell wall biosynthesis